MIPLSPNKHVLLLERDTWPKTCSNFTLLRRWKHTCTYVHVFVQCKWHDLWTLGVDCFDSKWGYRRILVHCSICNIGCTEEVTGDAEVWKTWRCASKDKHVLSNLSLIATMHNSVCAYFNFPESARQTDENNSGWGYVEHSWCIKGKLCVLKVKQLNTKYKTGTWLTVEVLYAYVSYFACLKCTCRSISACMCGRNIAFLAFSFIALRYSALFLVCG